MTVTRCHCGKAPTLSSACIWVEALVGRSSEVEDNWLLCEVLLSVYKSAVLLQHRTVLQCMGLLEVLLLLSVVVVSLGQMLTLLITVRACVEAKVLMQTESC